MMECLNLDIGLKSYQLVEGGTPLVFNPGDQNVYARYMEAMDEIKAVETEMSAKANAVIAADDSEAEKERTGAESLRIMRETDSRMKSILNKVFGVGNDFDKILCGVNLMALTSDNNRVINKVLEALSPIMQDGARACAETEVVKAKLNRAQRRANQ